MSDPSTFDRRFADHLAALAGREDRAALAALRRSLGKAPGEVADPYPHVGRLLPDDRRGEATYLLVAALFALHPAPWPPGPTPRRRDLGASFARLAQGTEGESVERRFVALLNSHRDDLPDHLRRAVGLLKAHEVRIDWALLLRDVQDWDRPDRRVQRAWARAFWTAGPATDPDDESAPDAREEAETAAV